MGLNVVDRIDNSVELRHVLISVSDKTGLEQLVPGLLKVNPGLKIFSTGGTFARLESILGAASADHLVPVSTYTGQPETQGGLVKTLDFKIYLGLLTETYNAAHQEDLARTSSVPIDMVVANLYPFKATIAQPDTTPENARGNIDIGGPCMIRASAKNFIRVASVTDPADYGRILAALEQNQGKLPLEFRFELARKAFAHTADYDTAIAGYLAQTPFAEVEGCY